MMKCLASMRLFVTIPEPPKGRCHYVEALEEFRRLWDLPADLARTARMDPLILLIDEYELLAECSTRSGWGT
jgi:hypothetical protein